MNEIVREWIKKAEGDYNTALREYRVRKHPNYDAAGFHAQQSIEKYLKATLQMYNIPFGKIHDMLVLMESCLHIIPELELHKDLLAYLNQFSIAFRYPGETATRDIAYHAIKSLKTLKPILENKLKNK